MALKCLQDVGLSKTSLVGEGRSMKVEAARRFSENVGQSVFKRDTVQHGDEAKRAIGRFNDERVLIKGRTLSVRCG
jgi:hypothetical protein